MLLRQSERSSFPVWHLLTFANFKWKYFLGNFSQSSLLASNANFAVVGLCIDEIAHVLIKVHLGKVLSENIHVAFEREAYVDGFFVSEQLCEDLVEDLTVC